MDDFISVSFLIIIVNFTKLLNEFLSLFYLVCLVESIRTNYSREPPTHTAVFLLRCVEHSKTVLDPQFKSRGLCRNMD
jgi:hypothetical protein